jgi:hypothetical protein
MPKISKEKKKHNMDKNIINKNSNKKKDKSALVATTTNTFDSFKVYSPLFLQFVPISC